MAHVQKLDPGFSLESSGLGQLGRELQDAFDGLLEYDGSRWVCRRCFG